MTTAWIVQAVLVALLVGAAAAAAERVAGWWGRPVRRWLWAVAMAGSLLLPLAGLWFPSSVPGPGWGLAGRGWDVLGDLPVAGWSPPAAGASGGAPHGAANEEGAGEAAGGGAGRAGREPSGGGGARAVLAGGGTLGFAWAAAVAILAALLARAYFRLRALARRCPPAEVDGVEVRVSRRTGPLVVGCLRPLVVLPRWVLAAPAEERRLIVLHEREHVEAGDTWLLAAAALAVVVMPWNLPLWWQHGRLRSAVETDCDARVLARGAAARAYGRALLRAAGRSARFGLLSPAMSESAVQLERRIVAMTARRPRHRLLVSLPLLTLAAGLVAVACDSATPHGGPTGPAGVRPAAAADGAVRDDTVHVSLRGHTRENVRVRLVPVGEIRDIEMLSAAGVLRDDGVRGLELITPAEVRVVAPGAFRLRAETIDPEEHVEILGVAGSGRIPSRASARGWGPWISFRAPGWHAGAGPVGRPALLPLLPPQPMEAPPAGEPGHVRVEGVTGERVTIRVTADGTTFTVLSAAAATWSADRQSLEVVTPAEFRIAEAARFDVRFVPVDPDATIRVQGVGGPDFGFRNVSATGPAIVICRSPRSAGIHTPPRAGSAGQDLQGACPAAGWRLPTPTIRSREP